MIYTISNGKYTLSVDSLGAELVSLKTNDSFEAMWQSGGSFWKKHAPLLFPVCGRLKDSKYSYRGKEYDIPTHGFISRCEFDVYELTDGKISLIAESSAETLEMFPFKFRFIAEYSFVGDELKCEYKITNETSEEMPYMFGWHPGFAYSEKMETLDDVTLDFGAPLTLKYHPLMNSVFVNPECEELNLPTGEYKIDTDFLYKTDTIILSGTNNSVVFKSDANDYALTLKWSENMPYICIWKYPDDGARYICLEPWSSLPADGNKAENFDTREMRRLAAKDTEVFTYTIRIER